MFWLILSRWIIYCPKLNVPQCEYGEMADFEGTISETYTFKRIKSEESVWPAFDINLRIAAAFNICILKKGTYSLKNLQCLWTHIFLRSPFSMSM